jgi:hypothetical protein
MAAGVSGQAAKAESSSKSSLGFFLTSAGLFRRIFLFSPESRFFLLPLYKFSILRYKGFG